MKIKVLVTDGQPLLAETLGISLSHYEDLSVIEDCAVTAAEAVKLAHETKPDVVLLDYWIFGMDGPHSVERVLTEMPVCKILLTSWFAGSRPWFNPPRDIERALRAGAVGFLPKHLRLHEIARAIRLAYEGQNPVYPHFLANLIQQMEDRDDRENERWQGLAKLTPRETEVLHLLARGLRVQDIADQLFLSMATLRTHVNHILEKTGTHSQMEAVAVARELGLIKE